MYVVCVNAQGAVSLSISSGLKLQVSLMVKASIYCNLYRKFMDTLKMLGYICACM